jgi:hypothetical protein
MEVFSDFLKVTIPATLVLYAMYLSIKAFLDRQSQEERHALKQEAYKTLFPLQIQAYERLTLFLERISPNNLLIRLSGQSPNILDFQQLLLAEIRQEYNHNLVQQLYVSAEAWEAVGRAQQETMTLINLAAKDLQPDAPAVELSKRIFDIVIQQGITPSDDALKIVKASFNNLQQNH